ncbi:MAG: DNA-directed DNA polymerase II small subunit [Promethearchaeia archaeon]
MQSANIQKRVIHRFLQSGINITPSSLEIILKLDNPLAKLSTIIKDVSFLPNFNSLLTPQILKKLQDKEIEQVLKRKTFQESPLDSEQSVEDIHKKGLTDNLKDKENQNKESEAQQEDFNIDDLEVSDDENFSESFDSIKGSATVIDAEEINIEQQGEIKEHSHQHSVSKSITQRAEKIQKTDENLDSSTEKTISKATIISRNSSGDFKPLAKEYTPQLEILKDPTGKLYTSGDYQDFYELYMDRFNRLEKLIRNRPDARSANKIKNIDRLSGSVEVSVYGLINSYRRTKNGHYFLTVEDKTGVINVLVRKDTENETLINNANKLLNDQMIYVKGTYKPGNKRKGIIFANELTTIDISRAFEPNISSEPLSIAYISDLHIGSHEFEEKIWQRFIKFLNGKIGDQNMKGIAGRIKYLIINGDLIDGIGVYPNQRDDLVINDIYAQYQKARELLSDVPDYIKIIYSSGNHEPVRNAIPRPAVPEKYAKLLLDLDIKLVGNPALIKTHGVKTLVYHGDSMIDINQTISGLENNTPVETMKELLRSRHLAPIYGSKTQIAPTDTDWLVIDEVPDIFHCGHIHINGKGNYHGVSLVNSGCFQAQTEFMKSFGIEPTPGIVPIFELDTLKGYELDFKTF